jgi:hypothetical protein
LLPHIAARPRIARESLHEPGVVLLEVGCLGSRQQKPLDRLPRLDRVIILRTQALPRTFVELGKQGSVHIPVGGDDFEDLPKPFPPLFFRGKEGREQVEKLVVRASVGQGTRERYPHGKHVVVLVFHRPVPRGRKAFVQGKEEISFPFLGEEPEGVADVPEDPPENLRGHGIVRNSRGRCGGAAPLPRVDLRAPQDGRDQLGGSREFLDDLPLALLVVDVGRQEHPPQCVATVGGLFRFNGSDDPAGKHFLVIVRVEVDPPYPFPLQKFHGQLIRLPRPRIVEAAEKCKEPLRRGFPVEP